MSDPLMRLLQELPVARLDPKRAERLRSRCRARLARNVRVASEPAITLTPLWQLLVGALGAAYLVAAIAEALRAYPLS